MAASSREAHPPGERRGTVHLTIVAEEGESGRLVLPGAAQLGRA
jgi:hypothetical protein